MCLEPQRASGRGRIDRDLLPPSSFIAASMDLTVMSTTQRHGELIADLAPERPALREAQMVGVRGASTAYQTWLFGNKLEMVLVANAPRLRVDQPAFVDAMGNGCAGGSPY